MHKSPTSYVINGVHNNTKSQENMLDMYVYKSLPVLSGTVPFLLCTLCARTEWNKSTWTFHAKFNATTMID